MDTYNYNDNNHYADKLSTLLDDLSQKEAKAAVRAIEETKATDLSRRQKSYGKWFDEAIFPILEDFAEVSSSILEIERNDDSYIISTITNQYGLDIADTCKMMKYALTFASYIGMNICDGAIALTLIFDYNNL